MQTTHSILKVSSSDSIQGSEKKLSLSQCLDSAINSLTQAGTKTESLQVDLAIILGTGLGSVVSELETSGFNIEHSIPYEAIDHFPHSSVVSHAGELILGRYEHLQVAIFQGRFHLYEGWSALETAFPIYLAKRLGANNIIISNAAGALNANLTVGELMLIDDHINLTGHNPLLIGWEDDIIGSRFPDMSQAYSAHLRELAANAASKAGIGLASGVYAAVLGPSLETSAERRYLRTIGADAVGMSTVTEVIAAAQCNMQVLGISAITNVATGQTNQPVDTIENVLENAAHAAQRLAKLLPFILKSY